jgi:TPP-dependent pyruvate/acetoin dehydrogenase alpha subunit
MLEDWATKDPIARYERRLTGSGMATEQDLKAIVSTLDAQLQEDLAWAEASPMPDPESGLSGVYGDRETARPLPPIVEEWEKRR